MDFWNDMATHRHMMGLGHGCNTPPRGDAAGSCQIDDGDVHRSFFHRFGINDAVFRYFEPAEVFARAQPRAPEASELTGSTDWLWMSLMRSGRAADAQAMLAAGANRIGTSASAARTAVGSSASRPRMASADTTTPGGTSNPARRSTARLPEARNGARPVHMA